MLENGSNLALDRWMGWYWRVLDGVSGDPRCWILLMMRRGTKQKAQTVSKCHLLRMWAGVHEFCLMCQQRCGIVWQQESYETEMVLGVLLKMSVKVPSFHGCVCV